MGLKQIGIPAQLQGVTPDVLCTDINWAFGQTGAGTITFWELFQDVIFLDTVARAANPSGLLQQEQGLYPILAIANARFHPKGPMEGRTRAEGNVGVLASLVRATRVDSDATPIPIRRGYDPTGAIWAALQGTQKTWADALPQEVFLRMLVLGQDMFGQPIPVGHDGKGLFDKEHPVNPLDKTNKKTYGNIHELPGKIEEASWADLRDKIERVLDFDGRSMPNRGCVPLVACAGYKTALRWRRFIGGKDATDATAPIVPVLVNGVPIGIYSCSVGGAQIIVDPYLYQIASDKEAAELTSFVFTRRGRPAAIMRESQTPQVHISGAEKEYENKAIEIVSDAEIGCGPGDPRSVHKVIEKAS